MIIIHRAGRRHAVADKYIAAREDVSALGVETCDSSHPQVVELTSSVLLRDQLTKATYESERQYISESTIMPN